MSSWGFNAAFKLLYSYNGCSTVTRHNSVRKCFTLRPNIDQEKKRGEVLELETSYHVGTPLRVSGYVGITE